MSLAEVAIKKKTFTYFVVALFTVGGIVSFFQLGQLEDPEFTVKTAVVVTFYPGATPVEVEQEVTDLIETAIQEMPEVDKIESDSRAGLSLITVDIDQKYWADVLPQLWDELRKKVRDVRDQLPPGAGTPQVSDDFSEVYGFVLALTGDGFDMFELDEYAKEIKKELSLVEGVARCEIWGTPTRAVYVDISQSQMTALGISPESVIAALKTQNMVVDAGSIDIAPNRLRVSPSGSFETPEEIGELVLRGTPLDLLDVPLEGATLETELDQRGEDVVRLKDVATVTATYQRPVQWWMRQNGNSPAYTISLSPKSGLNVVKVGEAIDERLNELMAEIPLGIEVEKVAWQGDLVEESIVGFLVNLLQAVLIVLVVLCVSMGLRMAVIVGIGGLVLTIIMSFVVMAVWGIDLQRMSLGALIIAMGMMVDNAIVVADGISVRLQKGMDRTKAAIEAASQPSSSLFGATIIAVMAFYPIFAAKSDSGEYCRALFQVVAVTLLLSWLLAMTIVPLLCIKMLPDPKEGADADPYGGGLFRVYRKMVGGAVRAKYAFILVMIALLGGALWGFGFVNQMFFPDSSRPQLMVDYWAPQGTRIEQVIEDVRKIEEKILDHELVDSVSTFVGQGPPRFYLPVDPESPYPEYAQLIINGENFKDVFQVGEELEPWLKENVPEALTRVRKYGVGPADTWKFDVLFTGPADADLATLRGLADQATAILEEEPLAREVRHNMRQRTPKIVPEYNQERGRWAIVTREDIGHATRRAFDGAQVGLYREKDDLYPIIVRQMEEERNRAAANLETLQVPRVGTSIPVPLAQVTDGIDVVFEDPIIRRWDRRRSVSVQCSPIDGVTFPKLQAAVMDEFNAIEAGLPPGYKMSWQGEYDSTASAQAALVPGGIPTLVVILIIVVLLYNALRPLAVILLTVPFVMIGVTPGFLITGGSFGFLALLGLMSLSGMMIKNGIVLLDEINLQRAGGAAPFDAVIDAGVSRLRPVLNAAATTVLGVVPLLKDPFWVAMAITVMFGLGVGTIMIMMVTPTLYAIFYGVKPGTGSEA